MPTIEEKEEIKEFVRQRYAQAIQQSTPSCCGNGGGSTLANNAAMINQIGYTPEDLKVIPSDAAMNSFGCGNPLAFAEVGSGQVVVDIGSGAGIDCFLAADRVGPDGRVIGVDMTPAMLERARENAKRSNYQNVEFRQGDAEALPVEDGSVDWVISNCVINLAPDKLKVFREVARVLKPGGQISVSDIVVGNLPWWVKRSKTFYASCIAGALKEDQYLQAIRVAGLEDVRIVSRFVYDETSINSFTGDEASCGCGPSGDRNSLLNRMEAWFLPIVLKWFSKPIARRLAGQVVSIKVTARKPM